MSTLGSSRFFSNLLDEYAKSPSVAICRVPELELLSTIPLIEPVLDHCCGDGRIAALAFPGRRIDAGADIDNEALAHARERDNYARVEWSDAGKRLPFDNASFATIFNNSSLEHIPNVDAAVAEIARVLRPGGFFYMNVLNSRFFARWPLDEATKKDYREFQPFYHSFDEAGWSEIFMRHGFDAPTFIDYFAEPTSRVFADLDYRYSAFYIKHRMSLEPLLTRVMPTALLRRRWRRRYQNLRWDALAGDGSGFLIAARRVA